MQIESKHCRHPHWHLATRAEFEAKAKLENKDSADRPHAYGLVDTRGDAFGKYRASPAFGFGSTGRGERAGDQSPGPTGYTPKDDRLRRRSPSAGFGASRRSGLEWEGSDSPGPGYDCRGGLGGPAARLLGRGAPAARPSLPGPGAYATASGSAPGAPRFGPPPGAPSRPRSGRERGRRGVLRLPPQGLRLRRQGLPRGGEAPGEGLHRRSADRREPHTVRAPRQVREKEREKGRDPGMPPTPPFLQSSSSLEAAPFCYAPISSAQETWIDGELR